jgi:hypothetical protein
MIENPEMFDDLFGDAATDEMPLEEEHVQTEAMLNVVAADEARLTPKAAGKSLFFDIETGPVALELLEELFDFDETKTKGYELLDQQFDPSSVKTGNMKDPAKIKAKIEEKKAEHEQAVADAKIAVGQSREDAWLRFCEQAPLSAITGQVLAIGYSRGDFPLEDGWPLLEHQDAAAGHNEFWLLNRFWLRFLDCLKVHDGTRLTGFNIFGFDLPFLIRRSWLLGVDVPPEVLHEGSRDWTRFNRLFLDLHQVWGCGIYGERIKLDRLAGYFGTTRKSGTGDQFHVLFNGTAEERHQAIEYLRTDLDVTCQVAAKMGAF